MGRLRAIAGAMIALLLPAGCADAEPQIPGPDGLRTPGVLTACVSADRAPIASVAEGADEATGFGPDALRAIATEWGVELQQVAMATGDLATQLRGGACDVVLGELQIGAEGTDGLDPLPLLRVGMVIVTSAATAPELVDASSLCGRFIAVVDGVTDRTPIDALAADCAAVALAGPVAQVYPKPSEMVLAVVNGIADAMLESSIAAVPLVEQHDGALVVAPGLLPADGVLGVFTRAGAPFVADLEAALDELRESGALAELAVAHGLDPAMLVAE